MPRWYTGQLPPPLQLFVKLLLLIIVVETSVMILMELFLNSLLPPAVRGITDALILALCLAPFIWWLAVLPLRRLAIIEKTKSNTLQVQMVDAVVTCDDDGIIVSLNPAAARTFGYAAGEIIGRAVSVLLPETAAVDPFRDGGAFRRPGEAAAIHEATGRRSDGSLFPMEISVSRVLHGNDELFVVIMRDVSERKRAEADLHESRSLFRSLSESAPVGIFHTDPHGTCLFTNRRWQEMTGLDADESVGSHWSRMVHPEDWQRIGRAWERYLSDGGDFREVFRLLTPQGEVRWVQGHATALRSDAGETIGHVGAVEDVTERKLADEGQQKFNAFLTATLESTPDAILMADDSGHVQVFNQNLLDLFDISADILERKDSEALLAHIARRVISPQDFPARVARILTVAETVSLNDIRLDDGRTFHCFSQPLWLAENRWGRFWSFRAASEGPPQG
ncbi:MAG TPA: PAS domain S-box protein [Geobacteraceae bacterium]